MNEDQYPENKHELVELPYTSSTVTNIPSTSGLTHSDTNLQEPTSNTDLKPEEFLENSSAGVRELIQNEENKNTLKKTLSDVGKFERFLTNKQETKKSMKLHQTC